MVDILLRVSGEKWKSYSCVPFTYARPDSLTLTLVDDAHEAEDVG